MFCEWWPAALELLYHNSTIAPGTELQTLQHLSNTGYRVADITPLQYRYRVPDPIHLFNTGYRVADKTPFNTRVADTTVVLYTAPDTRVA